MSATYHDLQGKSVLVTGGASGIGEAIVTAFCHQGAKVGFFDVADDASRSLCDHLEEKTNNRPHYTSLDLRYQDQIAPAVDSLAANIGTIDVLINNAARDDRHRAADVSPAEWKDKLDVNLSHQFFCAQAVRAGMAQKKAGSIINFSSVSFMLSLADLAVYETAKAGVIGMTRALAREWGGDAIRVNTVVPGCIMTTRQLELWVSPKDEARIQQEQCLHRRLVGDDVAQMVMFLASDVSAACSAQTFIVDGGIT